MAWQPQTAQSDTGWTPKTAQPDTDVSVQPDAEKKQSFAEDVTKDIKQDIKDEGRVLENLATGQRSLPSTALQTIANVTGPIRDVGGEAVKRIPGYATVSSAIGNAVGKGVQSIADAIDNPTTEKLALKARKIAGNHPELTEDATAMGKILGTEPALAGEKAVVSGATGKFNKIYQGTVNKNVLPNTAPSAPKPLPKGLFTGAGGKSITVAPKAVGGAHNILKTALKEDDINPLDVAQRLEEAKATGLPLTAADLITKETGGVQTHGKNITGLLKGVANMPGPGAAMVGEVASRGYTLSKRLGDALDNVFSREGKYKVSDEALKSMETETPKAYKTAFEGGSIAPLEKQFENKLNASSAEVMKAQRKVADIQNRITQIEGKSVTNSNVYVDNALIKNRRSTHEALQNAQKELTTAQEAHQETLDMLRQAQADSKKGVKGAVWNPRIQEFMEDDTVQNGMKKGLWIAKKEALANGEKFNPTEYGITGYDENGEPIVSKVPNMRLLDAGKKGLDAIINENKNPLTGKMNETGRAVTMLKNSYLKEIDAINPDYAKARKTYGDQASRLEALRDGENFLSMDKEEISRFMKDPDTTDAEKIAFSVGVRRKLQNALDTDSANPIKNIWRTGIKDKLEPLFPDKKSFDAFSTRMEHEQSMHRINSQVATGSHTNMLGNYQTAIKNPAKIVKGVMNPMGAASDMGMDMISKALAKQAAGMNKDTAALVARYLTTNDPQLWYDLANRIAE